MQAVYAALLLHSAGKEIDEKSVTKVLEATGDKPEAASVKALVASLEGVDIEEAIKTTAVAATAAPAAAPSGDAAPAEEKKEEKKEDEGKKQEEAAAGLSSLFG